MDFSLPVAGASLTEAQKNFLQAFTTECRRSIVKMVKNSQSGHPGGSLSALDFLAALYAFRVSDTNEKVIVSNGHISPAVYSVLAECGTIDKEDVIKNFREFGSKFEGHVTRHVDGIWYGTGPLGAGVSAAAGFAKAEQQKNSNETVFAVVGDGEMQEGQVHEMALWAAQEKLDNFCVYVDWNRVQLTDSLQDTLFINPTTFFTEKGWDVIEVDGHNADEIWNAIQAKSNGKPKAIIGKTIMGYGVPGMEEDGQNLKPTWHGQAPKPDMADEMLAKLGALTTEEFHVLEAFRKERNFGSVKNTFETVGERNDTIDMGTPRVYDAETVTDCRSAYGNALADLAKLNKTVLGSTADLGGSVKTHTMCKETPEQHIEFGICEQNMVSVCGGLSLNGFVPFCSTFGAFMTSRAKDQARVNDINNCNVKMVSTHCGLSVGEDGPTHQAIDDAGSMQGLLHTYPLEPADPNHCDRLVRYVAGHYGNFYVRMGRAKLPTLLAEDGSVFFDEHYQYDLGRTDVLRTGSDVTIVATGPMVHEALKARAAFANPEKVEIVIVSSIKQFDKTLVESIMKTGNVITIEDHNPLNGLASAVSLFVMQNGLIVDQFAPLAVREYQLSGTPNELYASAGVNADIIGKVLTEMFSEEV
ncbi:transketolase [bacterium DOLZORAL124_38_8]|nr:MAG: transketolase [bacterium DOLZORAL124_38_8]